MGCGASSPARAAAEEKKPEPPAPPPPPPPAEPAATATTTAAAAPPEKQESPPDERPQTAGKALPSKLLRAIFESIDTDCDGVLSRAELHAKLTQDDEVQRLLTDAGGDGTVIATIFDQVRSLTCVRRASQAAPLRPPRAHHAVPRPSPRRRLAARASSSRASRS